MWFPGYKRNDVLNLNLVQGYNSHENYIMWKNSTMQWGARYELQQTCKSNFKRFPFDNHDCQVSLVMIDPLEKVVANWAEKNPADLSNFENLQLPDWDVSIVEAEQFEMENYSGLRFTLRFRRVMGKHNLHTFIPSILLCIVTVFAGLIPVEKSSEKVTICVTTFLSMIALFGSAK